MCDMRQQGTDNFRLRLLEQDELIWQRCRNDETWSFLSQSVAVTKRHRISDGSQSVN